MGSHELESMSGGAEPGRPDETQRPGPVASTMGEPGTPAPPRHHSTVTDPSPPPDASTVDEPRLTCPNCQSPLAASEEQPGRLICRECGTGFRIELPTLDSIAPGARMPERFRILQRVGEGSFGVVWRAFDNHLRRYVALKIPHASFLASADFRTRFWREAQAAAAVRHPGIVPVYEVLADRPLTAIVSHFVDGVTLKELLEVRKLRFDEAARMVASVADALQHAHERGLVHRDVKPGNLMVEMSGVAFTRPLNSASITAIQDNPPGNPLIVDFGLALRDQAEIVLTTDGQIIGTPAYMSPEQAAGRGHQADGRSDVYSLGVVLYELLCGELPFRGTWSQIIQQVLREDPRPPRRVNDKIPRDLEIICLKAMAKEPNWRYASAAEFAEDLRLYLDRKPIKAREFGKAELAWRWARRNPLIASLSGISAFAAVAFVALLIAFATHEARSVDRLSRVSSALALDNGLDRCDRGEVPAGLAWLARALQLAPAGADDLQHVIRTNLNAWAGRTARLESYRPGEQEVEIASLAPAGSRLLTIEGGRSARLRSLPPLKSADILVDLGADALCASLDEQGRFFVTGHENAVRVWDTERGTPLGPPLAHPGQVGSVVLSGDGKTLATSASGNVVRAWKLPEGRPLGRPIPFPRAIGAVALSPQGDRLAVVCRDGKGSIYDPATGRKLSEIVNPSAVSVACFDPSGKRLATGGVTLEARLWDVATGSPLGSPMMHEEPVSVLAFSPDGRRLVTTSLDRVRLWDTATTTPEGPALRHGASVIQAGLADDGESLWSVSSDGSVRRWAIWKPAHQQRLDHQSAINCLAASPDGSRLLTASGGNTMKYEARLWDLPGGRPIGAPLPLAHTAVAAGFDRDGRTLVLATQDGSVLVIDPATATIRRTFDENDLIQSAAFEPSSRLIGTGTFEGHVRLRRPEDSEPSRALDLDSPIISLLIAEGGDRVVIGTADGQVVDWTPSTGAIDRRHPHRAEVMSLAFLGRDGTVISGSWDRTCCIHRPAGNRTATDVYLRHDSPVTCLALSPDQRTIVTGCADHSIRFWDPATGKPAGALVGHRGQVKAAAFADGGKVVVSGAWDSTARLWDMATRRPIGPTIEHGDSVQALAIHPGDGSCISGSFDGSARIFRLPDELRGDPARLALWCEVATGIELDTSDAVHVLSAADWNGRREKLWPGGSTAASAPGD